VPGRILRLPVLGSLGQKYFLATLLLQQLHSRHCTAGFVIAGGWVVLGGWRLYCRQMYWRTEGRLAALCGLLSTLYFV
jgi:hypothetical protein